MQVQVTIDFERYNPSQIISLIEQGLVTIDEVERCLDTSKFFSNTLSSYVQTTKNEQLGDTVIV